MLKIIKYLSRTIILALLCHSSFLQANLLVSPTHITFAQRQRSAKVFLINNGTETRTYRIGWKELKAKPQGGYREMSEQEQAGFASASTMLRFSPKQVTLKAGERQTVKLALRRPKGLADGEYRSHLALTALPLKTEKQSGTISLKMLLSYTLPVIVRQGKEISSQISIGKPTLFYNKARQRAYIKVPFIRQGLYSSRGNIRAYWLADGSSKEQLVAQLNGYNIYHELNQTVASLTWQHFKPSSGQLRIVYQDKAGNETLAETILPVTAAMFKQQGE